MKKLFGLFTVLLLGFTLVACNKDPQITFKEETISINVGDTKDLIYDITSGYEVEFSFSEEGIIEITNNSIKGLKAGEVIVTGTIKGTKIFEQFKVIVNKVDIPATSISIKGKNEGYIGDEINLEVEILPSNTTEKDVVWESSDIELATVENGKVKLLNLGTVEITAKVGNVSDVITINIIEKEVPVESIEITGDNEGYEGEKIYLTTIVLPEDATYTEITWLSSDIELATVENGVVTLLKAGTVEITAKINDVTKTITITIIKKEVPVESIEITGDNEGYVGGEIQLTAKVLPEDATYTEITWLSSDLELATVENGVVTLLKTGTVEITAKVNDVTKTITITILPEVVVENVAFINDVGYPTISDAILNANPGDVIKLVAIEHNEALTINKSQLTFTSLDAKATLTNKITLTSGLSGIKFENLIFTNKAQIHAPGTIDNFEFINNIVNDITLKPTQYSPANRVDVEAFIRLYTLSGSNVVGNVTVMNNKFNNIEADIISIARTSIDKEIIITNNEFNNFLNSAVRFDGGYNNGKYTIVNNIFKHDIAGTNNNVLLFRAYSPSGGQTQEIIIEGNEFINVGSLEMPIADTYPGTSVIAFSTFNDNLTYISISDNLFENTANNIHLRNVTSRPQNLNVNINYNEFRNTNGYYLYEAEDVTNIREADFNYNLFVDENGNEITELEILKDKIINNNNYEIFYKKEIDLVMGKIVPLIDPVTIIVDANLVGEVGSVVTEFDQEFIIGTSAFKTISEALNAAEEYAVIYLKSSQYNEELTINKNNITIIGPNKDVPTIDSQRAEEAELTNTIILDNVSNITFNGLKFSGQAKIINNGSVNKLIFNNNVVITNLVYLQGSKITGFIELLSPTQDTTHKDIILMNNHYTFTSSSAPRFILASNIENVYVLNNYFESSYDTYTDVLRFTGTNLGNDYIGLTGKLYVYSNTFKNVGQSAIFVTKYSKLDVKIINNNFDNIKTTAARFRNTLDTNNESNFIFNYNKLNINPLDSSGYINSALRIEKAGINVKVVANYNHFTTIPFSYYFGCPENLYFDARYNFYEAEENFIPQASKMNNVTLYDGWYTSLEQLPKYEEKLIIPMQEVKILNKVSTLIELETYLLQTEYSPENTTNTKLQFSSSNEDVATIDSYGNIFAKKAGTTTIKVFANSDSSIYDEMELEVLELERVKVSFEGPQALLENETLQLNVTKFGTNKEVRFSSENEEIATIDENGLITAHQKGNVLIVVYLDEEAVFDLDILVYETTTNELLKYLIETSQSQIEEQTIKYIGSDDGTLDYDHEIAPSVNYYLFNDDVTIKRNMLDPSAKNHSGLKMPSLEWIVIHDTANTSASAGAQANSNWATNPSNTGSSWHYTVGNDGWYQQLEDDDIGWHAGDGRNPVEFYDTGIIATKLSPKVTVSSDGYFEIEGQKTTIKAPSVNGNNATTNDLVDSGIRAVVKDGKYYLPSTRYISNYGGNIVMNGGNYNGIGIETAVNRGSDVWLTWQRTAKLVAQLLVEHDMLLDRVVFHNHFSAKPCPRTALESHNEDQLLKMIEVEYNILKKYANYEIEFISHNPEILNNQGRIISVLPQDTTVKYTIRVTSPTKEVSEVTLSAIIRGNILS